MEFRFLSEKPSLKIVVKSGEVVEFSPYYRTINGDIAAELRKIPHIFEIDPLENGSIEALPNRGVIRDASGKAKIANPTDGDDIVNYSTMRKAVDGGVQQVYSNIETVLMDKIPEATEENFGKTRFATALETLEGSCPNIALSPAKLKGVTDSMKSEMLSTIKNISNQGLELKEYKDEFATNNLNTIISPTYMTNSVAKYYAFTLTNVKEYINIPTGVSDYTRGVFETYAFKRDSPTPFWIQTLTMINGKIYVRSSQTMVWAITNPDIASLIDDQQRQIDELKNIINNRSIE